MLINEITVSVGRTINLGNFESLRIDLSARATIEDGADPEELTHSLSDWLRGQVRKLITQHSQK